MKNLLKLAVSWVALSMGSAYAVPVTINYTADNLILDFGVCANPGCSPLTNPGDFDILLPKGPNAGNWTNADSVTFDLDPGTYEFGFVANNYGTPNRGNPAGLLAEILWDGNANLSSSAWDVTTDGINYGSSTEWAKNGTGIWGSNLIGEISSDAQWIWTANNFNGDTDGVAGFRTSITIVAVPEPGTLALLLLGVGFLAFKRKIA